ncbi:MAG: mannose-6-phosphate isomerase, class I [Candidatus Nanopelagicales bacterium]|nr:mannose-6-phosphate isomerase, class I [Candidatus Nanopelagicales bacterium]MDZ4249916.1 mannose-6-phosphate isomerase, class I [Candidatus Nanopelagicales bacterium]
MELRPDRPILIGGVLKDYDWGVVDGLAAWTGQRDGRRQAELWFGAHASSPSPLAGDHSGLITDVLAPEDVPLLVKLLAAETPLSLQVHPDRATAIAMASEPGSRGLLADENEKTEMLVALAPSTVLVGWRPPVQAARLLGCAGVSPEVLAALDSGDSALAAALLLGSEAMSRTLEQWHSALTECGLDEVTVIAMSAVARRFGEDPGVAVATLLDARRLSPGEAVYLPAGVPHAYVHGMGAEVMTSSDNVLRLGLTHKTVSVEHALEAMRRDRTGTLLSVPGDGRYSVPGAPFEIVSVGHEPVEFEGGRYRLVLPVSGSAAADTGTDVATAPQGLALALTSRTPTVRITASGHTLVAVALAQDQV